MPCMPLCVAIEFQPACIHVPTTENRSNFIGNAHAFVLERSARWFGRLLLRASRLELHH